MLEIVLWSGIIFGGSIVYAMLGGQPAPRENKRDNKKETKDNYKETYNYFIDLPLSEQHDYIDNNVYLNEYAKDLKYDNKQSTAREVARRADKMGRSFTDRYNRY